MKRALALLVAFLATAVLLACGLTRSPKQEPVVLPAPDPPVTAEIVAPVTLETDHKIGAGRSFGGLTVFPVLAEDQLDLGPFVTLDQALHDKTGEVRETDRHGRVNTLMIANKGDKSIFVLAGTVVKGGKQDRQIAQDFAVGPGQTVAVDAFCVEQNRWNASRDGKATGGRFGTSRTLATSGVRAAGQYKKSQGEVWSKVGEVNRHNGKDSPTGTLAASLDDREIAARRTAVVGQVSGYMDSLEPQSQVVGVAYAVDGRVRSVRWFANHELYGMYRESLFNAAALEAITAERAAGPGARPNVAPPPPEAVKAFVTEIERSAVAEERVTPGENVNSYKETGKGYGSSATLKTAPSASPRSAGKAGRRGKKATISSDFTSK